MNDWQRVTRLNPCPICKRPDWCCIGEFFVNCMRIQSARSCSNGGWFHQLDAKVAPMPKLPPEPKIDVWPLFNKWQSRTVPDRISQLARLLGIDELPLRALGVAWAEEHDAWAFPMVNAERRVTGVRLRNALGEKWAVRGGRNGVFLPRCPSCQCCYICEGPTDTAALLSIGLFAIGRPSCNEGTAIICPLLQTLGIRSAVVVADHDEDKERPDSSTYNPGIDGANRLSEQLPVRNCVWIPPTKDAREFVRQGGTAATIESLSNGLRWTQPQRQQTEQHLNANP
jgi:hypothetical protein